jgi:TRAP-type uncharacterized transport system fused permease subunit
MWRTGWLGMRQAIMASLLPFLWVYDPALLMQGSWLSIVVVCCTTLCAIMLISRGVAVIRGSPAMMGAQAAALGVVVLAVGTSTLWLKQQLVLALVVAVVGFGAYLVMPALAKRVAGQ